MALLAQEDVRINVDNLLRALVSGGGWVLMFSLVTTVDILAPTRATFYRYHFWAKTVFG